MVEESGESDRQTMIPIGALGEIEFANEPSLFVERRISGIMELLVERMGETILEHVVLVGDPFPLEANTRFCLDASTTPRGIT